MQKQGEKSANTETPMIQQYRRVKAEHQDEILFFRMGDFYEMFFEDAELASRVLGIALTSRNKGTNAAPMAGVPIKAGDTYLRKLLEHGYKVAICEQLEEAAQAQGLVDRGVVRIVTAGTLTEDEVLPGKSNNFLLAIVPGKKETGLAWIDISTGQFIVHEVAVTNLTDEIGRIAPAECLLPEDARDAKIPLADGNQTLSAFLQYAKIPTTYRPPWFFGIDNARRLLLEHFHVASLDAYGCDDLKEALGAAGALLYYLEETQKTQLPYLGRLERYSCGAFMLLDQATRSCLELQTSLRGHHKQGTLLSVLDQTCTAMGARLLANWLSAPLIIPQKIDERLDGVEDFVRKAEQIPALRNELDKIQDLERLCARIVYERANARDLLSLQKSLAVIPRVAASVEDSSSAILVKLRSELTILDDLAKLLEQAIHPDPKPVLKEGGIIRDGYHAELDELRNLQSSSEQWMKDFEAQQIERTGIPKLKVDFNRVFGYYIEVTNAQGHKVPKDFIRKQTLKNAERYITPELKEHEEKVLAASERSKSLEYEIFMDLRQKVLAYIPQIRQIAYTIAYIDVLQALAKLARERGYVRPKLTSGTCLKIVGGRHPVLEISQSKPFVPNNLEMGPGREIVIITGPNMAGKSTYIRQGALLILMAQIGSFIPATEAEIGVVDRIFTRIGSADEIARGRSTFLVEMLETANILNNATARSFIALDEVGRGTSTFDGISLAWAIVEHIQHNIGARTLFATHYHEIAELAEIYPNIRNYNVAVQEWGDEITFLYKIAEGSADKSYGIHVARLAGIPKSLIQRAREILKNLEKHTEEFQVYTKRCCHKSDAAGSETDHLFKLVGQELIDTLSSLDINHLTPIEALQLLKELHENAKKL